MDSNAEYNQNSVPEAQGAYKVYSEDWFEIVKIKAERLSVSQFHVLPYSTEERMNWIRVRVEKGLDLPIPKVVISNEKIEVLTDWDVVNFYKTTEQELTVKIGVLNRDEQLSVSCKRMKDEKWHWLIVGDNLNRLKTICPDVSTERLSELVGLNRSVASRLIKCSREMSDRSKKLASNGLLSFACARKLITLSRDEREKIISDLCDGKLSQQKLKERLGIGKSKNEVIQVQKLVKKNADTIRFETLISEKLGFPVSINIEGKGGELTIRFFEIGDIESITDGLFGKKRGFDDF